MLRNNSKLLIHHRQRRTIFVCSVIILMAAASTFSLISCDLSKASQLANQLNSNISTRPVSVADLPIGGANLIESRTTNKTGFAKAGNLIVGKDVPLGRSFDLHTNETWSETGGSNKKPDECIHPEYVVFSWVLCLIALAAALKLYYLVKFFMASSMVVVFAILILVVFPDDFNRFAYEDAIKCLGMPLAAQMLVLLGTFLIMVTYHARLVEVTSRLDFIWKAKAEKELSNMRSNRELNDLLIKNILPDHVARRYLYNIAAMASDDLYSNTHTLCGVMFASIPNFQDFYSEDIENGKACIRILNEIICDFDELLNDARFVCIEKIKTIGSCYMAASGLCPEVKSDTNNTEEDAVCDLVEFAIAMRQKLREINRVSSSHTPVAYLPGRLSHPICTPAPLVF